MCAVRGQNMPFRSSLASFLFIQPNQHKLQGTDRRPTTAMARPTQRNAGGGEADEVRWTRRRTTTQEAPLAAISKKRRRAVAAGRCGARVGRRIRMLRELVPGCSGEAAGMGLEGLFREAADYIVHLQAQVRVMQMVLHELSPAQVDDDADDDDEDDGD